MDTLLQASHTDLTITTTLHRALVPYISQKRGSLTVLKVDTVVVTSRRVWLLLTEFGHHRWVSMLSGAIRSLGKVWHVSPIAVASNTLGGEGKGKHG